MQDKTAREFVECLENSFPLAGLGSGISPDYCRHRPCTPKKFRRGTRCAMRNTGVQDYDLVSLPTSAEVHNKLRRCHRAPRRPPSRRTCSCAERMLSFDRVFTALVGNRLNWIGNSLYITRKV